ncbi:stage II sporulation protein M [Flexivirga sp. ID2601S]|uniref:Stage II sporulation protein M n=1 Tax=Flexivirga aerilata TaxID=1656889 RepID=A0A849AIA2_9MICO|nr:stage II sporulation protein M [Flexivirga aerilata]
MDLDAYVMAHHAEWERLRVLGAQRRLTGAQADELLDLYQRVATHLSVIRSAAPDPTVVQYLSTLLAKARTAALGRRTASWSSVADFVVRQLPAVLYRARWWWIGAAAASILAAFVMGAWIARNPDVQTSFVSPEQAKKLVNGDFRDYYSEYAATDFAARVWTNNVWVAALCIAFGVLGAPVVYLLWQNVVNVAISGGIMVSYGHGGEFFGLILPHGILELTAVFVAAGAGLRLFWSWVEPGARTRSDSLAHEGRATVIVAIGLVGVLLVSGIIEAFVTPSPMPTWARIGIGILAEIAFLAYVFVLGRRAALAGETGDVGQVDQAAVRPVSA